MHTDAETPLILLLKNNKLLILTILITYYNACSACNPSQQTLKVIVLHLQLVGPYFCCSSCCCCYCNSCCCCYYCHSYCYYYCSCCCCCCWWFVCTITVIPLARCHMLYYNSFYINNTIKILYTFYCNPQLQQKFVACTYVHPKVLAVLNLILFCCCCLTCYR